MLRLLMKDTLMKDTLREQMLVADVILLLRNKDAVLKLRYMLCTPSNNWKRSLFLKQFWFQQ